MAAEERAGRALYGGLLTPAFVDVDRLGPDPDPGWPFRLDPFINVVCHAGRYLALEEGTPPYEITSELATVGLYDFGGVLPGMCAHPKLDPVTGEMVLFCYDVEEPFLTWAIVGPDGAVTSGPTPVAGVDRGFMIHDFAITERYVILVIGPGVLDVEAMMSGGAALQWRPELGTRVAVIRRTGPAIPAGSRPTPSGCGTSPTHTKPGSPMTGAYSSISRGGVRSGSPSISPSRCEVHWPGRRLTREGERSIWPTSRNEVGNFLGSTTVWWVVRTGT
jgi:hypothetical protein